MNASALMLFLRAAAINEGTTMELDPSETAELGWLRATNERSEQ